MQSKSSQIRQDMFPENRESHQHSAVQCLDNGFLKAFTAHTLEEVRNAEYYLADIQGQCLKHIRFLSELEGVHRESKIGYEIDEAEYSELVAFLAGLGESLVGVQQQLDRVSVV